MYLNYLHIINYRGIKDLRILFKPNLNVLIGSNGSCKSTVLDAIRLFYSLGDRDNDIDVVPEDFHKEIKQDDKAISYVETAKKIIIYYLFNGLSDTQKGAYASFLMEFKGKLCACVRISFEIDEKGRIFKHITCGNPENGNGLDYNTLQLFNCYYLKAVRDSTHDLMSTRNNLLGRVIKRKISKADTENEIRDIIKKANIELLNREEVEDTKSGINSNLHHILNKGNYNVDVQIEQNRIDYIVNVIKPLLPFGKNGEDSIRLWQNSLGFNNLIYIATVLSDIKDNHQDDVDSIYALLIEEPEAHLHPQLQVNLYNFLKEADPNDNSQLFITSHSPTLTSRIPLDNLIVLDKGAAYNVGECFKDRVKEKIICDTNAKKEFTEVRILELRKMLERYLDVTRSQLLFANGCVYIEGISEAQLLETFSRINKTSLSENQIEIVNADSTAFHQFLMLYNSNNEKKCLPHKVSFITDGDQYTDSKNYSLNNLLEDYNSIDELRQNIVNGKANSRTNNLLSISNNKKNILISIGYKTLEYQICISNVNDTIQKTKNNDLYKFLNDKYKTKIESIDDYLNSFGDKELDDNERINVGILFWKCIEKKSTFAQDLSYYLDSIMNEGIEPVFNIPEYIKKAINHVIE